MKEAQHLRVTLKRAYGSSQDKIRNRCIPAGTEVIVYSISSQVSKRPFIKCLFVDSESSVQHVVTSWDAVVYPEECTLALNTFFGKEGERVDSVVYCAFRQDFVGTQLWRDIDFCPICGKSLGEYVVIEKATEGEI